MIQLSEGCVRISVRELVEFVLRSGDIDNRITAEARNDAMAAGSRLHRRLQKAQGSAYRPEVPLSRTVSCGEFTVTVEGRADGIIDGEEPLIDEIKGVYRDVLEMEEPVPVHLAQAMCYAAIYAEKTGASAAGIRMTYCNLDEEEQIRYFTYRKTGEELESWFQDIVRKLHPWLAWMQESRTARNETIRTLEFPFSYREGQRDLAVSVYTAQKRGRRLFIQAPTGIGKTMSTVFPSVRALGEGLGERIFYLTAKTITRTAAEEAFGILRKKGLYFHTITLTAKEKVCVMEETDCNPEYCERARGHYDRVNDAVYDILTHEEAVTRETVLSYAEKHRVCPFELALDCSDFMDGIICDYNYAFDPDARLARYFADGKTGKYLFLVDEAHNLASRAREMYSASLSKGELLKAKRIFGKKKFPAARAMDALNRLMLAMKKDLEGEYRVYPEIGTLQAQAQRTYEALRKYLDENREAGDREDLLEFYFSLRSFLNIYELLDEHYRIYGELAEDGDFRVRLFCVNPVNNLGACLAQAESTVFFSATLLPLPYYRELISPAEEDYTVYAPSPFDRSHRGIFIAGDVSSRYRYRGTDSYRRIASYIAETARSRRGNYIVFFPSYTFLGHVLSETGYVEAESRETGYAGGRTAECDIIVQNSRMDEPAREAFLREFSEERSRSLMAFCVMGGIFSEGIDLRGEQLIGTLIVGTGLPMVCTEQRILQDYFEENGQNGFSFAYQYPGMTRVLQAAGRLIRTAEDRGVILLLDDRFLRRDYRGMFPREWTDTVRVSAGNVGEKLQDFWNGVYGLRGEQKQEDLHDGQGPEYDGQRG